MCPNSLYSGPQVSIMHRGHLKAKVLISNGWDYLGTWTFWGLVRFGVWHLGFTV